MPKNLDSKICFRQITPTYQESAKELILSGLGEHWGKIDYCLNPDLNNIAEYYKNDTFLLGFFHNELIATGALIELDNKVVEIVRVSVDQQYRQKGVGYVIVDKLKQTAKAQGFHKIVLETTTTWKNVVSFWLKCGFNNTHEIGGDTYFEYLIK